MDEGSESAQSGFSGSCQTTLVDWIQLVQLGRRDAVIQVRAHGGKGGTLWCQGGDIIDAAGDGLVGEPAVFRILSWTGGSVVVEFGATEHPRQIETPTTGLLLRAAYRRDSGVHELVTLPGAAQGAPVPRTFDSAGEITEVSEQTTVFRHDLPPQEDQTPPPPAEPSQEDRQFSLGFAISGGLSVLLLFSVLAGVWTYVTRARLDTPPAPAPAQVAGRAVAPAPRVPPRAVGDGNPAVHSSSSSESAPPVRARRMDLPPPVKTSGWLARRRAGMALARPSAASRLSTMTQRALEEPRASAATNPKVEVVKEDNPRIQIIEEAAPHRQPRIRIIDERQPHIEAVE